MIGKTFSHYRILEKLGEGGMGVVYLAEDTKLERQVAIKFLPHHIAGNSEERKRFEIEAKAAAALNHANIATIYNIEEAEDELFIVMEYIKGKELKDLVGVHHDLPLQQAIDYAIQIAKGLQAAHEKSIVHRDIKSSNIMITEKGEVKIMDFGLAKFHGSLHLTKTGTTVGTIAYMSPEQTRGEEADQKADIWSFGIVLFEMLTGKLPFQGDYEQAMMYAILNEQPQPIQNLLPELPSALIHLLDRMMEKDIKLRYQSISEVLIELQILQRSISTSSLSTVSYAQTSTSKKEKLNIKKFVIGSFTAIMVITLVIIFLFFNPFTSKNNLPPMKIVPFTTLPGMEITPAISPDGKEIAFAWNGGQGYFGDIYVQIIGTLEPQKLTNNSAADAYPIWTPDGRSILFARFTPYSEKAIKGSVQIIKIPARGGTEKVLYQWENLYGQAQEWPNFFDISKSGREFVSFVWDEDFGLASYDATVYNEFPIDTLTRPPSGWAGEIFNQFAPDGTILAFIRGKQWIGEGDLYLMPYPKGEAVKLAIIDGNFGGFSWLPNGKEMVFVADKKLYKVSLEDGKQERIAITSGIQVLHPCISPADNLMAFMQNTIQKTDLYLLDISNHNNINDPSEKIASSSFNEYNAAISPDGRKIVFISDRTGEWQIWVSNIDGSNTIPLIKIGTGFCHPVWSPDGSLIAFTNEGQLNIIHSTGGNPKQLKIENASFPNFSADGKSIYVSAEKSGTDPLQIWKVPLKEIDPIQITENSGEVAYESADGKWLYYSNFWTQEREGIFRMPVEGGKEVKIIDELIHRGHWRLKGNGIYYVLRSYGKYTMFFFDFNSKRTTKIREDYLNDFDYDGYFDISPDGKKMIFSRKDNPESDIMLIENFR